jgi:hypothetical protein
MARTLKVFRTSTGFYDAYVATSSRAAALRAWGSDHDLFARGVAEQVEDPQLMAEPLARPGVVIRKSRGSLAEQLAALPPERPRRERSSSDGGDGGGKVRYAPHKERELRAPKRPPQPEKAEPRPSRAKLDKAEAAARALETRQRAALDALGKREAELRRERRELEARQAKARDRASAATDRAKTIYDAEIERWRSTD